VLAYEATKIVHGENEANSAREASRALFSGGGEGNNVPTEYIPDEKTGQEIPAFKLFHEVAALCASGSEART